VGSAVRDGRRLIVVIAGLDSIDKRKQDAQKLLDFGFSQFKMLNLYEQGEVVTKARVWGGEEDWVNLIVPDAFRYAMAPFEQERAEMKVTYSGPLIAPVKQGDQVGKLRVLIDGTVVAETPLQIANDVAATPSIWRKAADSALIMIFGG
jgi:D-alanyl-D-alanine carboxypeptidase (penicillin-binding protein 5/6)